MMTRRELMTRTASAATWLALAQVGTRAEQRRFKIGACEWSLRKPGPDCFTVAKEIGLDGVQVDMGTATNNMWLRQPDMQRAYLEASKKTGVEIASLAMGELNRTPLKSDPRAAEWLADSIGVAQALGVKVVLIAAFSKGDLLGDPAGIDHTVAVLKQIAPQAEKAGVIFGLENYLSAEQNLAIVQRVGSRAVQVYYDVGNSTDKGYDIYKEIRMLKGQVCEFHAKDGKFMLGVGRVDFQKVRAAMDEIGYSGWIQIEAAAPHGVVPDYQAHRKFLNGIFS